MKFVKKAKWAKLTQMTEVEGEEKTQTAQITQSEDEVHQKRPLAEIGKDEEPTSVFTHVTSETLMSLS